MQEFRFPMPSGDRVVIIVSIVMVLGLVWLGAVRVGELLDLGGVDAWTLARSDRRFAGAVAGALAVVVAWAAWVVRMWRTSAMSALRVGPDHLECTLPSGPWPWSAAMPYRLLAGSGVSAAARRTTRGMRTGWWLVLSDPSRDVAVCLDLARWAGDNGAPVPLRGADDVANHPVVRSLRDVAGIEVRIR